MNNTGKYEQSGHARAHDEAHDLSETEKLILQACQDGPLAVSQLLNVLGYKSRTGHFKKSLSRLLALELLVRTVPDAPRSKKQKYRINDTTPFPGVQNQTST